jgi:hypothetical protein
VQQTQESYKLWLCGAALLAMSLGLAEPANSAGIVQPSPPDPILNGRPAGPCDPQTASADYVGGTDVDGNPVASADLDRQPVPLPGHMMIPLKSGAYIDADGKKLDPLLNPPAGCPARR